MLALHPFGSRLFTVPYFSVKSKMSIIEFDMPPSWSLDASETWESTKCPWVEVVEGKLSQLNECGTEELFSDSKKSSLKIPAVFVAVV